MYNHMHMHTPVSVDIHAHIHTHVCMYIPVNGIALLVTAHAHPSSRRQALTCTSHSSPTVKGPLIVTFVNSVSMVTLWVDVHK